MMFLHVHIWNVFLLYWYNSSSSISLEIMHQIYVKTYIPSTIFIVKIQFSCFYNPNINQTKIVSILLYLWGKFSQHDHIQDCELFLQGILFPKQVFCFQDCCKALVLLLVCHNKKQYKQTIALQKLQRILLLPNFLYFPLIVEVVWIINQG